ncbi:MAG: J domain-containing protein [Thermosynechococcaceae cyanobacterium]
MIDFDPYKTLEIFPTATLAEIKQAYRRLAKQFHPDSQHELAHHDRIARVNAAYALLKDPQRRQRYDANPHADATQARQQSTQTQQNWHRQERQDRQDAELLFQDWVKRVYTPVNRAINQILKPLKAEMTALAADPFDDALMEDFQRYLSDCRETLEKAQQQFRSMPNPANVAGIAAHLYYCLNHVEDGLNEFDWFTQSYEDSYLASGKEMFRKSAGLRREAQTALQSLQAMG